MIAEPRSGLQSALQGPEMELSLLRTDLLKRPTEGGAAGSEVGQGAPKVMEETLQVHPPACDRVTGWEECTLHHSSAGTQARSWG